MESEHIEYSPEASPEAASLESAFALSPPLLLVASLSAAVLLVGILAFYFRRKASSRGNIVLFVGPSDAGKTSILSALVYKQTLQTHASLQTNISTVSLSNGKVVLAVDVPGHPRIRDQFREHLSNAKAIAFVVDATTVSRNGPAVAEHLHHILHALTAIPPSQSAPSLIILAHKCDLLKTSASAGSSSVEVAVNRVRTVLERELEKRRASQSGGVGIEGLGADGEEASEMGGLDCTGPSGGVFKFVEWEGGEVEFLGTSVTVGAKLEEGDEKGGLHPLAGFVQWLEALP